MLTPFRMDLLSSGALLTLIYRSSKMKFERHGAIAGMALIIIGSAGPARTCPLRSYDVWKHPIEQRSIL